MTCPHKGYQVVGADLSLKMIDHAKKSNPYNDVIFSHMDISNIKEYEENSFNYSIMCQVIHELRSDKRLNQGKIYPVSYGTLNA